MLGLILAAATQLGAPAYPQLFENLSPETAQQQALVQSPDVRMATARVREMFASLAAARGAIGPAAIASYAEGPQAGGMGKTIAQHLTTVGLQTTIGQLFAYSPQVRQAQFAYESAQADLATAQATERTRVTGLFYDALRSSTELKVREAALARATADQKAARIRYNAGDAPRLDVVRADVAVAQARGDLATAQGARANAYQALAVATGTTPAAIRALPPSPVPVVPSIETAAQRALLMRPELISARAAVESQRAAVRATRIGILPAITLSGGYTTGVDSGQHVAGGSANVQVSLPISNANVARAAVEQARLDQAQAHLDALERQVSLEVAAAVRTYEADRVAAQAAGEARAAAAEALSAIEIGYRNGASSSLDVAAARQTYEQAVLADVTAYYAALQARTKLRTLMGER